MEQYDAELDYATLRRFQENISFNERDYQNIADDLKNGLNLYSVRFDYGKVV